MVLQKRLDYGSSGYQVPPMPHVPRSAKGKRSARKKAEANQMCAMDLLATVAKELLEAKQSTVAEEFDHESIKRSVLGSDMDCPQTSHTGSGHSSPFLKVELGNSLGTIPEKCSIGRHSPDSRESCKSKFVSGICGMEDPMDVDAKPQALVSSDSSVEVPSSSPKRGEHLDHRDDQEEDNSSGCTHPSTLPSKAAFRPQRIGDRRIRKLLASKYWKVAPAMLKDGELSDTEMKPVYRSSRNMCYTRQKAQRGSFKRIKLFERRTLSASDVGMCSEGTSDSPIKRSIKLEGSDSHATLHRSGNGESSSSTGQKPSYGGTGDLHVKFSIKSFKVPELFIEIPETATVASLKRTVVEAVTAILGGGLRVGVLLQGKKVRDDNKTLTQAGISQDNKIENLGFTLEPSPTQSPPSLMSPEDHHPLLLPFDTTEQLTRITDVVPPSDQPEQPPLTTIANCPESDHDSVHSPADVSSPDKTTADSRALVPVPAMNMEALAMVPLRKSRRSEMVQRRIRRPFSVTEVEALVQAVEKLGTGRWRDVKLRAFDNAKHRTYVDLKDKWKTLVHTARISPQQRRGEPVPQELLDRVLAAHAFWAQQQAKLQVKPQSGETSCLLL